jgi:hypothetical protein
MRQFSGLFWFALVIATGLGNFVVKQTVQNLDDELANVRRKTVVEQKEIHELTADWTFLNQPELLADLNKRYVGLVPVSPKQVAPSIDMIPLRLAPPATPPPPETAPQVAAVQAGPPPVAPAPASPASAEPSPMPSSRVPIVPMAAAVPARPTQPASLDALFAQVAGNR